MNRATNLGFVYPDGTRALEDISVRIEPGEFVALAGQNGSGKSTFSKCLSGLLSPTEGEVYLDQSPIQQFSGPERASRIGYVFQNPDHQLFNDTVREELRVGPLQQDLTESEIEQRVATAMETAGLREELLEEHPFFLPRGLRQRVALASVLSLQPRTIIVDEPTTGQDYPRSREVLGFLDELNRDGHTILMVTHDTHWIARYAERMLLFSDGQLLADDHPREVFQMTEKLKQTSVKPPQITRFGLEHFDQPFLTVEEAAEYLTDS